MHVTFAVGELVSYSVLACANKTKKLHVTMGIVCASNNYTIVPFLHTYICAGIIYNAKSKQCVLLPLVYVPYIIAFR